MFIMIRPVAKYLAKVHDPRQAKRLLHPLVAILCLGCVALMSGAKNPRVIADWWIATATERRSERTNWSEMQKTTNRL